MNTKDKISIIIPIFNEFENLPTLLDKITSVAIKNNLHHEIIAIDDGSKDKTSEKLKEYAGQNKNLKVIFFSRNFGQTAALSAGINEASGNIIVSIDADLENDPEDILILLEKLSEGYDIVSGWRKKRWQKNWFSRKFPSVMANKIISWATGTNLHDHGCTLKAYRSESIKDLPLYGEMHRFIAAYAASNGYKVSEVPVNYSPRKFGKSKYGIGRIWKVLLDLIVFKFLTDYSRRPIHLFGSLGLVSILIGIGSGILSIYYKLSVIHHKNFVETPLPTIMAMLIVVGVVLIMMGLLGEVIMRTYFENQGKKPYRIRERINF